MIRLERYGDVVRVRMSTWRSRSIRYEVSAYLTRRILIDCGFPHMARALAPVLDQLEPAGAIITHAHEDHAGNVGLLARRGIPLAIGERSLDELRAGHRIRAYRRYTWGQPRPFTEAFTPFDPAPLQLFPAPGHSPDQRIVWDAERQTLFSSDLWLGVHVKLMHAREEDPWQLVSDLRAAAALNPQRMFDSHRGPVEDPARALTDKADWLEQTIEAVSRRVDQGWDDRAIRRALLGREDLAGLVSRGEYARINLVRNVRAGLPAHREIRVPS